MRTSNAAAGAVSTSYPPQQEARGGGFGEVARLA
jgi:hypothetical protein